MAPHQLGSERLLQLCFCGWGWVSSSGYGQSFMMVFPLLSPFNEYCSYFCTYIIYKVLTLCRWCFIMWSTLCYILFVWKVTCKLNHSFVSNKTAIMLYIQLYISWCSSGKKLSKCLSWQTTIRMLSSIRKYHHPYILQYCSFNPMF